MRLFITRQTGNFLVLLLFLVVASCVSQTTTDLRVRESLALTTSSAYTLPGGDNDHFSFAMVGDLHLGGGNTGRLRRILDDAAAEGDQFILFLGHIVDEGARSDVESFHQTIADAGWTGKTFSVAGNHDVFFGGWTHYRDLTGPSTYAFTAGNSKFIALDTADATLGKRQIEWLRGQLAEPQPNHVFLFSHYLPVVSGVETYLKLSSETESLDLMALGTRYGIKGWFGAHHHSYVKQTIGNVDYIVAGGGGGRRMPPVKAYFFVQVRVDGDTVAYERKDVP